MKVFVFAPRLAVGFFCFLSAALVITDELEKAWPVFSRHKHLSLEQAEKDFVLWGSYQLPHA